MKKSILAIALMMALATGSTYAQSTKSSKGEAGACPAAAAAVKSTRNVADMCEFQDIQLTKDQKLKLGEAKQKYREQRKAIFESQKEEAAKSDSVKQATRLKARELRKAHLDEIKTILTADQYIQFLENSYLNNPGPRGFKGDGRNIKNRGPQFQKGFSRPDMRKKQMKKEA